jgi:hypothetical protein
MQLNPRPVRGSWDDGRTLDLHIRSSEFVGYNEYGHAQFESTRTELGELLCSTGSSTKAISLPSRRSRRPRLTSSAGGTRASM